MIINFVTYTFEPGNRDKFYREICHLLPTIRSIPGMLQWDYYLPIEDDGSTLYLFERWQDQSAIEYYHTQDTYREYQTIKNGIGCTFALNTVIAD